MAGTRIRRGVNPQQTSILFRESELEVRFGVRRIRRGYDGIGLPGRARQRIAAAFGS